MARFFKYLTGEPTKKALKKGNLALGVGEEAYGPTSSTGYYAGVSAPEGGYVITTLDGANKPQYRIAHNDTELMQVAKDLGNTNHTTESARAYLASRPNTWILTSSVHNIPTDGLVLYLDASNVASYPGSGTNWYDLSGKGLNATSYNSPTWNSFGWWELDGVNDHFVIPYNSAMNGWSSGQTLMIWFKHNYTSGRRNLWDQAYGGYGTWTHEQGESISQYFGDGAGNTSPYIGVGSGAPGRDRWHCMATTRNTSQHKWFKNGVKINTTNHSYGTLTSHNTRVAIGTGYAGYWTGNLAKVVAYDRALTEDEMSAAYYGGPIVTDGLAGHWDPGNIASYEIGTSTVYSMVGSVNGTLTNGATLSYENGGTWYLDGVDDYINLGTAAFSFDPSATNFSTGGWIYINSHKNYNTLINLGGTGAAHNFLGGNNSGYIEYRTRPASGTSVQQVRSTSPINTGEWYHIYVVCDTTNAYLYINGELNNTGTLSGMPTTTYDQNIGYYRDSALYHNGRIGPVSLYLNKSLSAAEVLQNFNAQRARFEV